MSRRFAECLLAASQVLGSLPVAAPWSASADDVIGHWPLLGDARDASPNALHARPHDVVWNAQGGAELDQTYSFAVHRGVMHTGTWKEVQVFRYLGPNQWEDTGRLGSELEVMGLALFNGKLYGGTLPLAQVYRLDEAGWTLTGRLDFSDVVYRRAWSMAVYQGRLFCGTLPSGHVHSLAAGAGVSYDVALAPSWRHVAAMRAGARLKLFVDGTPVAESLAFDAARFNLSLPAPLRIGFGEHDFFHGTLRDVRLYGRALSGPEVRQVFRAVGRAEGATR